MAKKSGRPPTGNPAGDCQDAPPEPAIPGVPAELQMLRVPEVARLLALSSRQVWRLINDQTLPVYHPSPGATRVALIDVRRHLERCRR